LATTRPNESSMTAETKPEPLNHEYLYGQLLFPVAPLSWLAPLWAFLCGVAASAGWAWTSARLLRFLSGLLLVGPLLGTAWAANIQTQWRAALTTGTKHSTTACSADSPPGLHVKALPYTLPGSISHRLALWLSAISLRWQTLQHDLRRPLLQMAVSTLFALSVAAGLGRWSLALTVLSLCTAYIAGWGPWHWRSKQLVTTSIPVLVAWLLGHFSFSNPEPASLTAAACFAAAFYGFSLLYRQPEQLTKGLFCQVAAQLVIFATLIYVQQPLVAAAVAILATPQFLLIPLLESPPGARAPAGARAEHGRYFHAVQLQVLLSMLLAAAALGYRS
jgi:hypothetical protein